MLALKICIKFGVNQGNLSKLFLVCFIVLMEVVQFVFQFFYLLEVFLVDNDLFSDSTEVVICSGDFFSIFEKYWHSIDSIHVSIRIKIM